MHVRPVLGAIDVIRATAPENPFTAVTVIMDAPLTPAGTVTLVGFAAIVKSCTVMVTVVEWDRMPLAPVTVMM